MAEKITLRAYIDNIETMLRQSRVDEAIAHSTHVLTFFPKNAEVYRNLGRALMRQKRYDEAGEIFRRLLAAVPDDFSAHYQLSVIYEQENRGDAALWHIERAFDQQPSSATVNDTMRQLYKKFRDVEVDKIQLTAGAVANQYLKANMLPEALEVLERTLQRIPDRIDLRLMKASALWRADQVIDAAETALDVLEVYPYALEANRILSELWLEQERPSDAQRYLIRVDVIDPYLAYEIATGEQAGDTHFLLETLDFGKYAASLATSDAVPDWLSNIEDTSATTAFDDSEIEDDVLDAIEQDFNALEESDLAVNDDDWLKEIHDDSEPLQPTTKKVTDNLEDLLPDDFEFPDSAGTDDTIADADLSNLPAFENTDEMGLDDLFGDMEADDNLLDDLFGDDMPDDGADSTGLTGLLGEDDYASTGTENLTGLLNKLGGDGEVDEDSDDLSWLSEVAEGGYDRGSVPDIFADDDADDITLEASDDDPMAWLSDDNQLDEVFEQDDSQAETVDPNDPMAWLSGSGIEFDEDAEDQPLFFEEDESSTLESDEVDPMAWLNQDDSADDDVQAQPSGMVTMQFDDEDDDNPLAWLEEEGIDFEASSEFEALKLEDVADTNDLLTGQLENLDATPADDDPIAWLEEEGVEFLEDEMDEPVADDSWVSDDDMLDEMLNLADLTNTSEDDSISEEDAFDWMAEESSDDGEWAGQAINTGDLEWRSDDSDELDWMAEDAADDNEWAGQAINTGDLEWRSDDSEGDGLDWMDDSAEAVADDSMAWLQEGGIELEDEEDDFDFEEDAIAEEDPMAWLEEGGVELEDEQDDFDFEEDAVAEEDPMAWLNDGGIELEDEQDDFDFEEDAIAQELDWMNDDSGADDGFNFMDEPAAALDDNFSSTEQKTGMLDFLNTQDDAAIPDLDLSDLDDLEEEVLFSDSGTDWLSMLDEDVENAAEEFGWTEDAMEDDQAEFANEDDMDFGFDDEQEAEPAEDMDWMSELRDDSEDDFGFDDEQEAQPAEDMDWMSELNDDSEDDFGFDDEQEAQPAEDMDWMSELDANPELEVETDDEDGGWGDLGEGFTGELEAETGDEDMGWGDLGPGFTGELEADASDADDGWGDLGEGFTGELEADAESEAVSEIDWGADLSDASEDEFAFDDDYNEFDDEFDDYEEESSEPIAADWLAGMGLDTGETEAVSEEEAQPADTDWLAGMGLDTGETEAVSEEEAQPADTDWLSDLGIEDGDDTGEGDAEFADYGDLEADDAFGFDDFGTEEDDMAEEDFSFDDFEQDDQADESEEDIELAEMDWMAELSEENTDDFANEPEIDPWATDDDALADAVAEEDPDAWMSELEDESDEQDFAPDDRDAWMSELEEEQEPELSTADPDAWMSELGVEEDDSEPEPDLEAQRFMNTVELSDNQDEFEEDWATETVGDEFDNFEFDEEDDAFADFEEEDEAAQAEQEVDWLTATSELESVDDEEGWGIPSQGFTDKLNPDVVKQTSELSSTTFTDRLQDYEEREEQGDNWLADVAVSEENEWSEEEIAEYYGDDVNVATKGMSEMLDSIRSRDDEDVEITIDEFEEEEPEWLKATGEFIQSVEDVEETEFIEPEPEPINQFPDAKDAFELLAAKRAAEEASSFGEETEQVAAENAPDWLNAMVPGLDLDFEAEDEGHLDEGFEERETTLRERSQNESGTINTDFDWLQDIVEEETGMMDAVDYEDDSTPPPPPMGTPQPWAFAFSSPPVWARGEALQNLADATSSATADLPDYLSFDDFDEMGEVDDTLYDDDLDDSFEFETDEMQSQDTNFNIDDDTVTTQNDALEFDDNEFDFAEGGIEIDDEFDDAFEGDFDELDEYDNDFYDFDEDDDDDDFKFED